MKRSSLFDDDTRPALTRLVAEVLQRWPDHAQYMSKSLADRSAAVLDVSENLSKIVLQLAEIEPGGIGQAVDDYRFLCQEIVPPEELYFRRHGEYRLNSFAAANAEVYSNGPFMDRYMNGLLCSNIIWRHHALAFSSFAHDYLPRLPSGAKHLEIGPGHGIFLYYAASAANVASAVGWDVSPASIAKTRAALTVLGITEGVDLVERNMFDAIDDESEMFDSIVMSELLEHVEDPVGALKIAAHHMKPGGHLWINVPANSPMPDHIYLVDSPEHADDLVRQAGFEDLSSLAFPMTGVPLEKALRQHLTISCIVSARKPL